jgi:hypothetical protein
VVVECVSKTISTLDCLLRLMSGSASGSGRREHP